ncbi:MAG: histidine phosphatase family protein [Gammaproteobacteria bacterium]|nr:histidine phosphatase family protein [Gammaproteobacteria bacterium]
MTETVIDLIRHGEPVGGRAYRGHGVDDPLSEKGWQQMWSAVGETYSWQKLFTSPMSRCREFAEALARRTGAIVIVDDRLKEIGFGAWEGRTPEQIQATDPDEYAGFYRDPVNNRPEGAEPLQGFRSRVVDAYENILADSDAGRILVVTHAGVIRALMTHVLQAPEAAMYRIKVTNASITRIRYRDNIPTIESHGNTSV